MSNSILITTFSTWKSHHTTNASDDLLHLLLEKELDSFHHLRGIPVDFELSHQHVLTHFDTLKPKVLICCGMNKERSKLNIESRAIIDKQILKTGLDFIREHLADYKMPESITFIDALPKGATGKIDRKLLKKNYSISSSK